MTRLIVEADGGSRGNPGPAAYGALIRDPATGRVLAEAAESIGIATNNVAEYRGLIAGLRLAAELAADALDVRMDSKLVIEQMAGRWKVKHPDMKPLALQALRLLPAETSWTWVPRAQNAAADALLNKVLDGGPPVWRVRPDIDGGDSARSSERSDEPGTARSRAPEPDRGTPTVLVLRVDPDAGASGCASGMPAITDPAGARAARDRVLRDHPGQTVRMTGDERSVALLVGHLLTGDDQLLPRLELAAGSEAELAWYPDGTGVLRRLGG